MIEQVDLDLKIKALLDYELGKNIRVHSKKVVLKTDRNQIYDLVANQLGVHKVMVRRVARQLILDYAERFQILNDGIFDFNGYEKRHQEF